MGFTHHVQHELGGVKDIHLALAADVVPLTFRGFVTNPQDRFAMIHDEEPIANAAAVAVDWDGAIRLRIQDDDGDELLGMLPGSVVVGAVCNNRVDAMRVDVCADEMIRSGFGSRVRIARVVGRLFGELATLDGPVDFIGRDVNQSATACANTLQDVVGTDNVGADEIIVANDGVADMGFGGEVIRNRRAVLLVEMLDEFKVSDVYAFKRHAIQNVRKVTDISGVGTLVDDNNFVFGVFTQMADDEVGTDKPQSASDEYGFHGKNTNTRGLLHVR